jgi:hypothetical protein
LFAAPPHTLLFDSFGVELRRSVTIELETVVYVESGLLHFVLLVPVMPPSRALRLLVSASPFILSVLSCSETVQPPTDPRGLAGVYLLEASSGRYAPIAGSFTLTQDLRVERRVRYTSAAGESEYVTSGTFDLQHDGAIVFALNEPCDGAICVWTIRASRTGEHFTFQYPDPADGPPMTETYGRQ